uniref:Uncharacterized protein n=2 Tax=Oryza TaxID=4527 RepID=A0A0E0ERS3_9ORYZ
MQIRPSLMASFVGWRMKGDMADLILLALEMAPDRHLVASFIGWRKKGDIFMASLVVWRRKGEIFMA